MQRFFRYYLIKLRRRRKIPIILGVLVILLALFAHICLAYYLANNEPNDAKLYSQLAKNILNQGIYSVETESPFNPTLIRLPGYPLFIAAIYYLFGIGNDTAVRIIQAVIHTTTCGIIALICWNWFKDKKRRKIAARMAFLLSALCPFTVIFTATILTETLTTFLMAAMTLTATFAFKSDKRKSLLIWWILTGLLAGCAVLLRPDSGLFAFGIGLTLVITGLFKHADSESEFLSRLIRVFWQGIIFSIAFTIPLVPWTIRNEQVFGLFQPLAPTHAEMPGEFVAHGYFQWVRSWIDDSKYIEPMLWNMEDKPIKVEQIPASAFDSEEERSRVSALLDQYNHPPNSEQSDEQNSSDDTKSDDSDSTKDDKDEADDDKDNADDNKDDADQTPETNQPDLKISPEIDAGFAQIAQERIERAPVRYYVWLPLKRAVVMWFDTHSMYYPFSGELFPLKDLDNEANQEIWLPLFSILVWIYTFLTAVGAFFMWRVKDGESRRWLLLAALMTLPRIIFFATLENPEPRYVVELFTFTAILGAIALARLKFKRENGKFSLEYFYGKD